MCMCGVWSIFANFAVVREVLYTSSQSLCLGSGPALGVDNMTAAGVSSFSNSSRCPGRGRAGRPPVYAAAAPRHRRAWRCMLCGPAAAPNSAPRPPRMPLRPRPRDRPPCRDGRGARVEVPAFTISGGLIKYISCVGDDLTTLIAGRRRRRPRGTSSTGELVPGFTPATPFAATPLQRLRRDTQAARREVARSEHAVAAAISRPALCSASKLLREDAPSTFGTKHESNQKGEWRQRCDKRVEAEPGCVVDRCVRVRE